MTSALADSVQQFNRVTGATAASLQAPVLEALLAAGGDDQVKRLTAHVTRTSPLTETTAKPLIADAVKNAGAKGTDQTAQDLSADLLSALPTVDVELQNPAMLGDPARIVFAGVFAAVAAGCVTMLALLTDTDHPPSTATAAGLAALGAFSALLTIVVVMGYKNVVIKTGDSSATDKAS